jgi:hypothetical protein
VLHHGQRQPLIIDTLIDNKVDWTRKHVGTLRQFYGKAPFAKRYIPALEDVLCRPWTHLVDLNLAVAALMAGWLKLAPHTFRASELGISGRQSQRLIDLCRHFGANRYLSGDAASDYLDVELFASHGIEVVWQNYQHPTYAQQHQPFVPYLSAIDLLLNCGDDSAAILRNEKTR